MAFQMDSQNKGIKVVERTDNDGNGTGLLLLQIHFPTHLSDNQIIQFYHHGMIDYLEFRVNSKTEKLLDRLGEKFTMIAGNISTHSLSPTVGCKIFSSFPYASGYTYRPARKRIFIDHKISFKNKIEDMAVTTEIDFANLPWMDKKPEKTDEPTNKSFKTFITKNQETPELPDHFHWENFTLLGEGHYTQIYAYTNWSMLLPFVGEGDTLELQHIINQEDKDSQEDDYRVVPDSPASIDSTHRDF